MADTTGKPPASPMQQPGTWDAVAAGYAAELCHHTEYAQEALKMANLPSSARILDVGCGPGVLSFVAAPAVTHVTAVDFSAGMIAQLRSRAEREAVTNLEAEVMDAQALALPDASFDAVFCLFAFMFFPDRARAFREIHRVLRPGGRLLVATWAPIAKRPLMKICFDALAEALPELPPMQKGDLQQPDECIAELSEAGFRDVEVRAFCASMHVNSPEHYLEVMERTGAPFALLKQRMGEAAWSAASARLLAAVRKQIAADGADLPAEALLTRGTR